MTTYDNASQGTVYSFPQVNLATPFTRNIRGPKGRRGRVVRLAVQVTASTTGALSTVSVTTTAPVLPVSPRLPPPTGTSTVLSYQIPITTAPAGLTSDANPNAIVRDGNYFIQIIPADFDVVFATTAAGAGTADMELTVEWF